MSFVIALNLSEMLGRFARSRVDARRSRRGQRRVAPPEAGADLQQQILVLGLWSAWMTPQGSPCSIPRNPCRLTSPRIGEAGTKCTRLRVRVSPCIVPSRRLSGRGACCLPRRRAGLIRLDLRYAETHLTIAVEDFGRWRPFVKREERGRASISCTGSWMAYRFARRRRRRGCSLPRNSAISRQPNAPVVRSGFPRYGGLTVVLDFCCVVELPPAPGAAGCVVVVVLDVTVHGCQTNTPTAMMATSAIRIAKPA
jgi:hypothetical protein